ncbi:hypothetical protein LMH87_011638 [Akanthomyces muscarius]|uniref:C3H1-type domain-containing protein n=1 Tax=Akanthomyces muscarius TaxID=2231603 RepID=A0A9W8QA43_AKAMU|nr:hypothetical protein LMH87_011638 [Akanthomyces muscarius]KAJ4150910.1 hypothetical protein LMH87_011638 [Akanthomyces muscarius]
MAASNLDTTAGRRATPYCHFFQAGRCNKGSSCSFLHDTGVLKSSKFTPQTAKAGKPSNPAAEYGGTQRTCKFFQTGHCKFGETCVFLHNKVGKPPQSPTDEPSEQQGRTDDFTITIGGAFVQFEAGARVSKIRLQSDFSAARIEGLPRNTSK